MTTISYCAYSPNKQPLTPLDYDQVNLLNKGAPHDITSRVKDVVQRHLDYKGTEKFRVEFTRQQITFSLKSGSDVQNRTLTNDSGKWMLSKNSAPATALAPELQKEVDQIIDEVLYRIGQSRGPGAPVSRSHASSTFGSSGPGYASAPRLYPSQTGQFDPRFASFESSHFESRSRRSSYPAASSRADDYPRIDSSKPSQYRSRSSSVDSSRSSTSHSSHSSDSSEKTSLLSRVKELEEALAASNGQREEALEAQRKDFHQYQEKHDTAYDELQTTVAAVRRELDHLREVNTKDKAEMQRQVQEATAAKDKTSRAAKEKIAELEASVAEKEAQLRESQGNLERFKREALEEQKTIKSKLAQVQAALDEINGLTKRQISQLEEQLSGVQAELSRAKESNAEALAKAALEIAALKKQLAAASSEAETKFADDLAGLRNLIEEKTTQLEEAARIAELGKKQIEALQSDLKSAIAQAEKMKKAEAEIREQLAAEQEKAKKMEASSKEQLAFKQQGIEKLEKLLRQFQARVASKTEENTALTAQVERLGKDAQKQSEELRSLYALLLETQKALKSEQLTTQLLQDTMRAREAQRLAPRAKTFQPTEQAKELISTLTAELGTSSRLYIPGETAVVKADDRTNKEEQ